MNISGLWRIFAAQAECLPSRMDAGVILSGILAGGGGILDLSVTSLSFGTRDSGCRLLPLWSSCTRLGRRLLSSSQTLILLEVDDTLFLSAEVPCGCFSPPGVDAKGLMECPTGKMVVWSDALGTGVVDLARLAAPIALAGTGSGFPGGVLRSDLDRFLASWTSVNISFALS